ncbi:GcrA family cell cycle regulator [Zavarzinia sp. CC-PAN008]|uniref:GcrA family cell cycle regulator n=1 Tax=Zavarzinia sp. CC-PAN008 TaxID=3243332 RepID=UPI003F749629
MAWTDERISTLKHLWEQGLSASQIAARLGDVTRNAVIGKVHRLGLGGRPSPVRAERPKRAPAPRPVVAVVAAAPQPIPARPRPVPVPAPAAEQPEPMARVSLMGMKERMCKWPVGEPQDGGFFFCGRKTVSTTPYCAEHAAKAYQPVPKRDRRRVG